MGVRALSRANVGVGRRKANVIITTNAGYYGSWDWITIGPPTVWDIGEALFTTCWVFVLGCVVREKFTKFYPGGITHFGDLISP